MERDHQNGPLGVLQIDHDLYEAMIAHVRGAYPHEGCGLIAFNGARPVRLFPGTNTEHSATRYNMDPSEVVAALDEMEHRGWRLGAIFHSHPRTSAVPSRTDLRHAYDAYYQDALMIIVSLAKPEPDVRAYQISGEPHEIPVVVLAR